MSHVSFDTMKRKLASRPGVTNPGALAAYIARKKYGAKAVAEHAASGTSMAHAKPKRKKGKHHAAIAKFVAKNGGK